MHRFVIILTVICLQPIILHGIVIIRIWANNAHSISKFRNMNRHDNNNINILGESSLHAALKNWYAQPGDLIETPVDGHIIDIKRADLMIEIQYRNFSAIKKKLVKLLEDHRVRVVHPIAEVKWITRLSEEGGATLSRRRSPKKGRPEHIFVELVHIPELVKHPNFSVELILIEQEEFRTNDGKGSWRRRGWSIIDHKLINIRDRLQLETTDAYRNFIPQNIHQPFTTGELSDTLAIPMNLAQRMVYCLRKMDLVEVVGKQGRYNLNSLIE